MTDQELLDAIQCLPQFGELWKKVLDDERTTRFTTDQTNIRSGTKRDDAYIFEQDRLMRDVFELTSIPTHKAIINAARELLDHGNEQDVRRFLQHRLYQLEILTGKAYVHSDGFFCHDGALTSLLSACATHAQWILQLELPTVKRWIPDDAALVAALERIKNNPCDRNARSLINDKSGILSNTMAPTPKPAAPIDPTRRLYYQPFKDSGRTQVFGTAEGTQKLIDEFNFHAHGDNSYTLKDDDITTLQKWGLKVESGFLSRIESILITKIKIPPSDCRELSAPQMLGLLKNHAPETKGKAAKPRKRRKGTDDDWLPIALNLLKDRHSDAEIARRVGIAKSTLSADERWQRAKKVFAEGDKKPTKFERRGGVRRSITNAQSNDDPNDDDNI